MERFPPLWLTTPALVNPPAVQLIAPLPLTVVLLTTVAPVTPPPPRTIVPLLVTATFDRSVMPASSVTDAPSANEGLMLTALAKLSVPPLQLNRVGSPDRSSAFT